MGPHGRKSLRVNDYVKGDISIWASSWVDPMENSIPIIAERSMYFDTGVVEGGHQAVGCQPAYEWYFAEGYTGPGFEEYICIYNPGYVGKTKAKLELTDEWGEVRDYEVELPSSGRTTLKVNDLWPGKSVSAHVKAIDNVTIVAERSMYFKYAGGRSGGSVAPGVVKPATTWYFAEGYAGN